MQGKRIIGDGCIIDGRQYVVQGINKLIRGIVQGVCCRSSYFACKQLVAGNTLHMRKEARLTYEKLAEQFSAVHGFLQCPIH